MKTAIVKVPRAFLYEEPQFADGSGAYYKVADEIFLGWAVKVLEEKDGICRIASHYGYEGYVRAEQLLECPPEALRRRDQEGTVSVVRERMADVMEIPKVQGRVLASLTRGSFLTPLEERKEGYRRVRLADGTEGYVPEKAIKKRLDSDRYLYEPGWQFHSQSLPAGEEEESFRRKTAETALSYLGTQYRWGGKSAQGIDCSGLAFMSYFLNGILIYRDASIQEAYPIRQIPAKSLKTGDLLFFPGHVALYLGEGKYVHSTGHEDSFGCTINSLNPEDPDYRRDLKESLSMAGRLELFQ